MPRAWAYPVSYHRIVTSETADLDEIRRNWEAFGRDDPLWAILTVPAMRGGLWDPAAFMATGRTRSRTCSASSRISASP